jgi:hypothetical protein
VNKVWKSSKATFIFHLATPFSLNWLSTRRTPGRIQTTSRFHFQQTVSSTNKNYQPKHTQTDFEDQHGELSIPPIYENKNYQPKHTQTDFEDQHGELSIPPIYEEYSANKVTSPKSDLALLIFEIEAFSVISHTNKRQRFVSLPIAIDSPSLLEVCFPTSQNSNNYPIYLDSTSVDSPIFSPFEYKGTSPQSPSSFFSSFIPFNNQLLETLPYNPQTFTAKDTMVAAGVGGAGGIAVGGPGERVGNQSWTLRIFTKVAARYVPLVIPVPLHDLPKNYMKNLPKFTGQGYLTAAEHINFFDQFADILGLEHEDVYSRLLVQTFEGKVRTWF